jgi:hypothetical protein
VIRLGSFAALGLPLLFFGGAPRSAQNPLPGSELATLAAAPARASVPFGPGEEAEYSVKIAVFGAGKARLAVSSLETVRGTETYRLDMEIKGGKFGFGVNDVWRSWMDTGTLATLRFMKDIHEGGYDPPARQFEIYPRERRWERVDDPNETGRTASDLPLDELSFIYYIRTLPTLNVGQTITLNSYFKDDGNPVVIKVLRKERRKVPAGTFNTVVVQPLIKTSKLFSEGGKAELYFTDDAARHLVYLHTEIPKFPGSLTLHLEKLREGQSIAAARTPRASTPAR